MAHEVTTVVPAVSDVPLCFYHANCMDGLISAAVVHLYYKGEVECIPIQYKDATPLNHMRDRDVLLVDFTFEPQEILPHLHTLRSLTIIDHHKDAMRPWVAIAEENQHTNLHVEYDGKRSGAGMTWRHFFGCEGNMRSADMPILIQYAQEYDLWTKGLPFTDEVQSGLRFMFPPKDAKLAQMGEYLTQATASDVEQLKNIGAIILRQEMIMVEEFIGRHLVFQDMLGYKGVPVCAVPRELANQAGELLYTRYPDAPFVVLFEDSYQTQQRKYSFRSKRGSGVNVSEIAEHFGGKGHENSSGATTHVELVFL